MTKQTRGRPRNPAREAARQSGARSYTDSATCEICGSNEKYTANGGCKPCAVERGKVRYARLSEEERAVQREKGHERYISRLTSDSEST